MSDSKQFPPLKSLHSESALNPVKLRNFDRLTTEVLLASLALEQQGCLKTRPDGTIDGTILDGHHRIYVLRIRGVEVDNLPRDVVQKDQQ